MLNVGFWILNFGSVAVFGSGEARVRQSPQSLPGVAVSELERGLTSFQTRKTPKKMVGRTLFS